MNRGHWPASEDTLLPYLCSTYGADACE